MIKNYPHIKSIYLLSWAMLVHNKTRLVFGILGVSTAFFLAIAQFGLLAGWINSSTALITHSKVDLWVMAKNSVSYEYGTPIPRQTVYRARSTPGVAWAQTMIVAWNVWQPHDGSNISVEIIGLDYDKVGAPWFMKEGDISVIYKPETVIIDELYQDLLQIKAVNDIAKLNDQNVIVGGLSEGVRSFSNTPHVFTTIKQALNYDVFYRDDEITYVLIRCEPGSDIMAVKTALSQELNTLDILTSDEFSDRTARFWMLGTGAGIGVVFTAFLGLLVGAVITSQTLFSITQENLNNYAALLAIGFERHLLIKVVLLQSTIMGIAAMILGTCEFMPLTWLSSRSSLPVEFYGPLFLVLIIIFSLICLLASTLSVRSIFKIDPVIIFSMK